jgi:hypothetical protein
MIDDYIKKYKIKKKRVPQVKKLFKITQDPRLSTFIVNSTKNDPEIVDYLIDNYIARSKKSKFKNPGAIIYTMFETIQIDYISHKKKTGTEISKELFEFYINSGATKIITLINQVGEQLIFEVVKDHKGTVSFIYKNTIKEYKYFDEKKK